MRAARLLALAMLLQSRGRMTAAELATEVEVSERTIYRDIDALCTAGIPICSETGPGGGFSLLANYRMRVDGLTQSEVQALFAASIPDALSALGLRQASGDALRKIAAALPAPSRLHAEEVRQLVHLDPVSWTEAEEELPHLPAVQEAVWQRRALHIRYRSARGQEVERVIHPYGLVAKAGTWYLVAAEAQAAVHVFRVSRIRQAMLAEDIFARPDGFDLATFWRDWCAGIGANQRKHPTILHLATPLLGGMPSAAMRGVYIVPTLHDDDVR